MCFPFQENMRRRISKEQIQTMTKKHNHITYCTVCHPGMPSMCRNRGFFPASKASFIIFLSSLFRCRFSWIRSSVIQTSFNSNYLLMTWKRSGRYKNLLMLWRGVPLFLTVVRRWVFSMTGSMLSWSNKMFFNFAQSNSMLDFCCMKHANFVTWFLENCEEFYR